MKCSFLFFFFCVPCLVFAEAEVPSPEIEVHATALRLRDEITPEAHAVSLEQPSGQVDLAPALRRLPGILVRDRSGPGSLVTAFQAQSLSASDSQVSIDEIPIINPLGTGVNFSLFPAALMERIDGRSAFDSSYHRLHDARPAPGGRIHLTTLGVRRQGDSRFRAGAMYGLNNTGQTTAAFRGGDDNSHHLLGATLFTTDGSFRYRDPVSQDVASRAGNDSTGAGALAKKTWILKKGTAGGDEETSLTTMLIGSHLDHSIPGSLNFPSKDHEKDDFHLLSLKFVSPRTFVKASATHTRTGVRGIDPSSSTDDRFYIGFAQAGWSLFPNQSSTDQKSLQAHLILDNEYDWYHSNDGTFHRNVVGFTAQGQWRPFSLVPLKIAPLLRQEVASEFSGAQDYRISALYDLDEATVLSLGFAYDHGYPPLTAFSGYTSAFGLVRPNKSLGVERHRLWTASAVRQTENTSFYSSLFYDRATNRSIFSVYNDGTAQYVALPEVEAVGGTIDGQWFPVTALSLRSSLTVQRAQDLLRKRELPYKPRLQGLISVGLRPLKCLLASIEETYFSRRRISSPDDAVQGESYLAPFVSTAFRLDLQLTSKSLAYFRVNNIFDRAGWDSPGYPLAGRSFWLGYSYGE